MGIQKNALKELVGNDAVIGQSEITMTFGVNFNEVKNPALGDSGICMESLTYATTEVIDSEIDSQLSAFQLDVNSMMEKLRSVVQVRESDVKTLVETKKRELCSYLRGFMNGILSPLGCSADITLVNLRHDEAEYYDDEESCLDAVFKKYVKEFGHNTLDSSHAFLHEENVDVFALYVSAWQKDVDNCVKDFGVYLVTIDGVE